MTQYYILAILHHFAVFSLVAILAIELALIHTNLTPAIIQRIGYFDLAYGAVATAILIIGFLRVFYGGKGADYYFSNPFFWTKLGGVSDRGCPVGIADDPLHRLAAGDGEGLPRASQSRCRAGGSRLADRRIGGSDDHSPLRRGDGSRHRPLTRCARACRREGGGENRFATSCVLLAGIAALVEKALLLLGHGAPEDRVPVGKPPEAPHDAAMPLGMGNVGLPRRRTSATARS